jgi:Mn2+/Fe2+ NRAMP family transporter
MAIAVQEATARLGLFSGKGLAVLIKQEFPKWVLYLALTLVVGANSFNIGADLGSMAAATRLLIPIPQTILVIGFASAMAFLEIAIPYRQYSKVLRWLCISILSYVLVLFIVNVSWHEVLRNLLIPSFSFKRAEIAAVIAVFGTTISPYLFFWQTSEEVEEGPVQPGDSPQHVKTHLRSMRGDVTAGMFSGVFVMFAIMVTSAATLHANGMVNIGTAEDAARALEPLAGSSAKVLFAIGILGTGLLAVPVLAGASSYAISEALGWREGLSLKMSQAKGFYFVILGSMLLGLAMNFIGLNPVRALYLSAVLNGLAAPPLIVMILLLSRRKHVLGEHTSGKISQFGVGMAALISAALPIAFIFAR